MHLKILVVKDTWHLKFRTAEKNNGQKYFSHHFLGNSLLVLDLTWQSDSEEQDKRDMARSLEHEFGHMVNIFMDIIKISNFDPCDKNLRRNSRIFDRTQ